jgi:nucleotide sugar dehydrogenase
VVLLKILNLNADQIRNAVQSGEVTIAIYGAGKVGLPIAVVFAELGAKVVAVDIDEDLVNKINNGENPVKNEEEMDEKFAKCIENGNLKASTDLLESAKTADVIIVIVPTVLDENKLLNETPLIGAFENVGAGLNREDVVILESTVPPYFVERHIKPLLEQKSELKAGIDFGLGFSPERVFSGRIIPDLIYRYPKIVSGIDQKTTEAMATLYGMIAQKGVIKLSNIRTAEAMKIFEGIYRDVNIALANELALVAEKLKIDIIELINAANTQPFSNILIPGAGVGGHCIPVYPYFILNLQDLEGLDMRLIATARQVNEYMPYHMVELLEEGLQDLNKSYQNVNITIMGLAFRGDVKEYRNAPTLSVVNFLKNKVKKLKCFDPLFSSDEIVKILGIQGVDSLENAFIDSDCLIFLTDHDLFKTLDLKNLVKKMKAHGLIVDGRHIFDPKTVLKLGLHYKGVGRVV